MPINVKEKQEQSKFRAIEEANYKSPGRNYGIFSKKGNKILLKSLLLEKNKQISKSPDQFKQKRKETPKCMQ